MKTRLNRTIKQNLLEKVKVKNQVSVSSLEEDYPETIVHGPFRRKNLLDLVDKLNPDPKAVAKSNNSEYFYENQKDKYGF